MRVLPLWLSLSLLPSLASAASHDLDRTYGAAGRLLIDPRLTPDGPEYPLRAAGAVAGGGYVLIEETRTDEGISIARIGLDASGEFGTFVDLHIPAIALGAALILPDGRAVLAVAGPGPGDVNELRIHRFLANGTHDASFGGGDGIVTFSDAGGHVIPSAIALAGDGSLAVTGYFDPTAITAPDGSDRLTFVARATGDGLPLAAFGGGDGFVTNDLLPNQAENPAALAVLANGRVLLCDFGSFGAQEDAILVRLRSTGAVDSYGAGGVAYYDSSTPQQNMDDRCVDIDVNPLDNSTVMTVTRRGSFADYGVRRVNVDAAGNAAASFDDFALAGTNDAELTYAPDGSAVLAALGYEADGVPAIYFARFVFNLLDGNFGTLGKQRHPVLLPFGAPANNVDVSQLHVARDARGRLFAATSVQAYNPTRSGISSMRIFNEVPFANGFE